MAGRRTHHTQTKKLKQRTHDTTTAAKPTQNTSGEHRIIETARTQQTQPQTDHAFKIHTDSNFQTSDARPPQLRTRETEIEPPSTNTGTWKCYPYLI
ncbi:Hypothetical predicted protein [Pelobates cultripes]|uniref:Uncharacterized protein n=1 Tax=Pelobates cultripes TaxID=61616 RepID=A0AAD1VM82_PELCU|nr:Hypothetical predicted protein [Pelobates cultripes]